MLSHAQRVAAQAMLHVNPLLLAGHGLTHSELQEKPGNDLDGLIGAWCITGGSLIAAACNCLSEPSSADRQRSPSCGSALPGPGPGLNILTKANNRRP